MSDKLHLILTSGTREKLQMAGMIAAVAAVTDTEVSVFLSMNALTYFIKGRDKQAPAEGELGTLMNAKNVPSFTDLFKQAVDLGNARIYPCSMAMDVLDVTEADLDPHLGKPMGLTKFLDGIGGSHVLTF
jgi:peroxiredoxin family protein